MTRQSKRPRPAEMGHVSGDDVAAIWRQLGLTFDDRTCQEMAGRVGLWNAAAVCVEEQGRNELAKAHRVLSEWCARERKKLEELFRQSGARLVLESVGEKDFNKDPNGYLDLRANYVDAKMRALELALSDVADRVEQLPPRQAMWALPAHMIWQHARHLLERSGRKAGTSPKSIAVQFTSEVLYKLGYGGTNGATSEAVSQVIKHPTGRRQRRSSLG
jgi:hypothetical protein